MTIREFKNYIETIQAFDKYLSSIDDLGISLYETPIPELFYKMQHSYEELIFNQDAIDVIDWWLYERPGVNGNDDPVIFSKTFDENGNEVPTDTIEDLWNMIKNDLK